MLHNRAVLQAQPHEFRQCVQVVIRTHAIFARGQNLRLRWLRDRASGVAARAVAGDVIGDESGAGQPEKLKALVRLDARNVVDRKRLGVRVHRGIRLQRARKMLRGAVVASVNLQPKVRVVHVSQAHAKA